MLVALAVRVPAGTNLVTSAFGLAVLGLVIRHGNVVRKTVVSGYALMAALTTAAAVTMYLVIWAIPINVRPWGLSMMIWSGLNLAWLVVAEIRHRDYVLCVAIVAMAGLLTSTVLEFVGLSDRVVVAGQFWVLLSVMTLWNRERVVSWLGSRRAWRLFQWCPDSSRAPSRAFYQTAVDEARRRDQRTWRGIAKIGLARCMFNAGETHDALALMQEAADTLHSASRPWAAIAYVQLAQWLLTSDRGGADEAEGLADAAIELTSSLARAHRLRAWAFLIRAVCRVSRGDQMAARSDVETAAALLRRHRDPRLNPMMQRLRVQLVYGEDAPTAAG